MKPVVSLIVLALAILPGRQSGERAIPSKTASAANEKRQPANTPAADSTVIAAGDIVDCSHLADSEATAKLLDSIPGTVLAVGDLAYPDGSSANFRCYDKTWGRHKARTRPAPGNHEYHTPGAAGYLKYFGKTAGSPGHAYYSFNLGAWHVIALDSQCKDAGGCEKGSPEEMWLRKDLAKNASNCILAFWHVPLFSSGNEHGNAPQMKPFWDDLYSAGADVVLNGHDHDYERFAPQNPDGVADPDHGIREFVVGTGGKSRRGFKDPAPTSEIRDSSTFGVLQMTLSAHGYEWKFIPVAGGQFSDSGSGSCHK
jgi:acid phosphatase type 7